ncbi:hypothetical protein FSP39_002845 [Pinctada imbricata]|uniref:Uncharacterized protein n=1 Tax=Pinctada imbricata TaxID=66713 RepID=A0AA89CAI5_PINIB|nr:hypothetical protein FSP39_002845 [Pinctada imbricata]
MPNEMHVSNVAKETIYASRKRKDKSFHTEDIFGLDNVIQVDFWDFAGQAIYYSTHPTYFSDRCLYLLVIDVSRSTAAKIDDLDIDPSRKSPHDVMGMNKHFIVMS